MYRFQIYDLDKFRPNYNLIVNPRSQVVLVVDFKFNNLVIANKEEDLCNLRLKRAQESEQRAIVYKLLEEKESQIQPDTDKMTKKQRK